MAMRCILFAMVASAATAAAGDATLDWLLKEHATTAPATIPAEAGESPLVRPQRAVAQRGEITLNDGQRLAGEITTTPDKPLRIWIAAESRYVDVMLEGVESIRASVVWERDEREWHFMASGSDLKEYTGRTYPARELVYEFTMNDGVKVAGGVVAPLYVGEGEERRMLVLNKRQKGEVGQKLGELLYVQEVRLQREK